MRKAIEITPGFCILWALLLLLLPLRLILAAGVAALFHELCHALTIRALGGKVLSFSIGAGGMIMETTPLSRWREIVCALAGPAGSFALAALYGRFPYLALCGFVQGCFNLLPLYPLDGGRVLSRILQMAFPNGWIRIRYAIELIVLILLLSAALRIQMGIGPIVAWAMLAMRKIPCKETRFGVE